jgi:spore coat polysaccharide biosynthesis protein SpsF
MEVGESSMTARVMDRATRAAEWMNSLGNSDVVMMIPEGDPLKERYARTYDIFEGPKEDVLKRFVLAAKEYDADYIVRLTADCAWMTSQMIAKCLRDAFKYDADYCSNVLVRTFMEGLDVEVLSRPLLFHLDRVVTEPAHREHVTSAIPGLLSHGGLGEFSVHTVMSDYDYSHIKTSIDTMDEYNNCLRLLKQRSRKKRLASEYGSVSS